MRGANRGKVAPQVPWLHARVRVCVRVCMYLVVVIQNVHDEPHWGFLWHAPLVRLVQVVHEAL